MLTRKSTTKQAESQCFQHRILLLKMNLDLTIITRSETHVNPCNEKELDVLSILLNLWQKLLPHSCALVLPLIYLEDYEIH